MLISGHVQLFWKIFVSFLPSKSKLSPSVKQKNHGLRMQWIFIFPDQKMEGYDLIPLGKHATDVPGIKREVIAVSQSAYDDKISLPYFLFHELAELGRIKSNSPYGSRPDQQTVDKAHRESMDETILLWSKDHPGELMPAHLRAIKRKGKAAEYVGEWTDGWMGKHKVNWSRRGLSSHDKDTLFAYATLFAQRAQAVGGEDFRQLDAKASGRFNKMELKGTDFGDLSNLNVEITAVVPFRAQ